MLTNSDFWDSIQSIINDGLIQRAWQNSKNMQTNSSTGSCYLNDFHRRNSVAAQKEARLMSLRPFSREQKIRQIQTLKESAVSKELSNKLRDKLH